MGCHGPGVLDKAVPIEQSHGLTADGKTVAPHFEQADGPAFKDWNRDFSGFSRMFRQKRLLRESEGNFRGRRCLSCGNITTAESARGFGVCMRNSPWEIIGHGMNTNVFNIWQAEEFLSTGYFGISDD